MTRHLVATALLLCAACSVAPSDTRPEEVKRAAEKTAAVRATGGDAAERAAYLQNIELRNFSVHQGTGTNGPGAFFEGEVKNLGERSCDRVQITIYLLDASGRSIAEHQSYAVFVGGFVSEASLPLKPNYSRTFSGGFSPVPSDWSGTADAKVTDVIFSK